METNTYKMRAESPFDFCRAWKTIAMPTWNVSGDNLIGLGDCEITFTCPWPLEHIRRVLELIPDGHVMAETLALLGDYTGDRK